jgi:hypothetical protein
LPTPKNFKEDEPRYIDGFLIFPSILKTNYKNIQITLSKEDKLLVDTTKEYLIGSITSKDRSNTYSKYIKRITKKYFGFEVI